MFFSRFSQNNNSIFFLDDNFSTAKRRVNYNFIAGPLLAVNVGSMYFCATLVHRCLLATYQHWLHYLPPYFQALGRPLRWGISIIVTDPTSLNLSATYVLYCTAVCVITQLHTSNNL